MLLKGFCLLGLQRHAEKYRFSDPMQKKKKEAQFIYVFKESCICTVFSNTHTGHEGNAVCIRQSGALQKFMDYGSLQPKSLAMLVGADVNSSPWTSGKSQSGDRWQKGMA